MGLFGKIFEKKECAFCGGEIGMLGNRKLEDGNMCKHCAEKLSPWFSERRRSTVADIQEQLDYREDNKAAVEAFHTTRTLGRGTKILLDEDHQKFMVTRAKNLKDANPDVLDYTQVTGVDVDIDEDRREEMRQDKEGKRVSYTPKRYHYSYDFHVTIFVNHPYFNEMRIRLCDSDISMGDAVPEMRKPDPHTNPDYIEYEKMAYEIKELLTGVREQTRETQAVADREVSCPWCGAMTTPNAKGCCAYCGGALN